MMNHGGALTIYFINGGRSFIDWTKYMNFSTLHLRYIKKMCVNNENEVNQSLLLYYMDVNNCSNKEKNHSRDERQSRDTTLDDVVCLHNVRSLELEGSIFSHS